MNEKHEWRDFPLKHQTVPLVILLILLVIHRSDEALESSKQV